MQNKQKIVWSTTLDEWEKRMQKHVIELSQELKAALKSRKS